MVYLLGKKETSTNKSKGGQEAGRKFIKNMKGILLFGIFLFFFVNSFGQKGIGKGNTPPSSTTPATSGSTTAQTTTPATMPGYNYKIKKRHLIEFISKKGTWAVYKKKVSYNCIRYQPKKAPHKIIPPANTINRQIINKTASKRINLCDTFHVNFLSKDTIPITINTSIQLTNDSISEIQHDSLIIDTLIWTTEVDTILKYSDRPLYVGISQDSGKLQFMFHGQTKMNKDSTFKDGRVHKILYAIRHLNFRCDKHKHRPIYYWHGLKLKWNPDERWYTKLKVNHKKRKYRELRKITVIKASDSIQNYFLFIPNSYTLNDPQYCADVNYNIWTWGAVTIPFKYQIYENATFGGNLTTSFTIPLYIGYEFGQTRFYTNPTNTYNRFTFLSSIFFGPTSISLASNSSPPNASNAAAGMTAGPSFEMIIGSFNVGLFAGCDFPITSAPSGTSLEYASIVTTNSFFPINKMSPFKYLHPWFGLGIGYNLGTFQNNYSHHVNGTTKAAFN